jgi:peroxiredoxin
MSGVASLLLLAASLEVGPAVGEKIPSFQATDQEGRARTFADLRGPKGLVLLFFRSADW